MVVVVVVVVLLMCKRWKEMCSDCLSSCVTWSDRSKQLLRWWLLVLLDQIGDGSMTRRDDEVE